MVQAQADRSVQSQKILLTLLSLTHVGNSTRKADQLLAHVRKELDAALKERTAPWSHVGIASRRPYFPDSRNDGKHDLPAPSHS